MELLFDRGTLLLREAPRAVADSRRFQILWDPRVHAFRAPAHCYAALRRFLDATGSAWIDRVAPRTLPPCRLSEPPLRGYQADALSAWERAGRRGVVALPTGSGKTRVALAAVSRARCSTLILVPTRVLLAQWMDQISALNGGAVGVVGDGEHRVLPITVCTFESAFRRMDEFGDRFGMLVVDEVHHFGGGGRAEALEMCAASARIGLTATPPSEMERLDALVGPVVCRHRIAEMSGTHLAPYRHEKIAVALTASERAAYDAAYGPFLELCRRFRRTDPGAGWTQLLRAASKSAEGRAALEGYRRGRRIVGSAHGKLEVLRRLLGDLGQDRVFVFTDENTAAYRVSREMLIPAITCDIARPERAAVLEGLRSGRLRAVVSARVLNEGIDLPDARAGIILGGSLGGREQVQRVGRLLRPAEGKCAVVYELVVRDTFEAGLSRRRGEWLAS